MTEVAHDIRVLESALIAFSEGASDEKFSAMWSLEKLLSEKKSALADFEAAVGA
jgi:hypothetical protein